MHAVTWLRRASWIAAINASLAIATPALARDDEESEEKTNGRQEQHEEIVREIRKVRAARHGASKYHLDVRLEPVSKALNEQLDLKGEGVLVEDVGKEGSAAKAGIKEHDIILSVGDKPIKDARDLLAALNESEGKDLSLGLMRGGKKMTVTVTPKKREAGDGKTKFDVGVDTEEIERLIKDKLKHAGVDMRMHMLQAGKVLPKGAFISHSELPDDVTINIHKEGKKPAEIEVKKGDQSWSVKDDDFSKLPDDVRRYVEPFARGGHRFLTLGVDGKQFTIATPAIPPMPARPAVPGAPSARADERLERRLDEMNRRMQDMRNQMEEMRKGLRERKADRGEEKKDGDGA